MKIEEVVALANAGFSKSEILGFAGQNQNQNQIQNQNQNQIQNQNQNQNQIQNQNQNDQVLDAINKLTATIQASNIQNTGNTGTNPPRTETDIINDMMKIMN
jgi:hypothetical protein